MKKYLKMPVIDCDEFILRDIQSADFVDMYEYGQDDETVKYLSWGPFLQVGEALFAIENFFLTRPKKGLPVGYAIFYKADQKMIGTIDFHTLDLKANSAEIGFCLNRQYWGRGIMPRALKEMIKIGFEYLEYQKIIIKHIKENYQSKQVILKCDFRFENIKKDDFFNTKRNSYHDVLNYSITKEEYERRVLR